MLSIGTVDPSPPSDHATVVKAPEPVPYIANRRTIFLAGSIDPSNGGERWHLKMAHRLSHLPVTVLDPWRDDWDSNWVQRKSDERFAAQTRWELENQERADVVSFYFHPKSDAPVSLLELGLSAHTGKVLVCCPDGFRRKGNVEIVCERMGIPLLETFDDLVKAVAERLQS
ncbi:hypothetical protein C8Q80DRAFT_146033 [Daedaleopsis nitida]|nr:hypothetical protein C8Q80DRAFT_146033 [Daedaleopsis nitida]